LARESAWRKPNLVDALRDRRLIAVAGDVGYFIVHGLSFSL
jgi:hypothetical protein